MKRMLKTPRTNIERTRKKLKKKKKKKKKYIIEIQQKKPLKKNL